jgi:indole-3-glycerol phosphate synthase
MPARLDQILQAKAKEVEQAKAALPLAELTARVGNRQAERDFRAAIVQPGKLTLIAELKRKSPSRGMLRERFDPVRLAQEMEQAGASALSVLTDEPHFGGSLEFLRNAKQFTELPVLRKDFIIDPYQIYQAAFYQADAVLLIVRALTPAMLRQCVETAGELGLSALVEVHAADELGAALDAGAMIIGINHRDLATFELHPELSDQLVPRIPAGRVIVIESGLQTAADLKRVAGLGAHAVLIGESLMTAPSPAAKIQELFRTIW